MKNRLSLLLMAAFISAPAWSDSTINTDVKPVFVLSPEAVGKEIESTRWSLNRSSMAGVLNDSVVDNSNHLLRRARQELDAGNLRTAREWVQRAAAPLAAMDPAARAGRHPDPLGYKQGLRETLMSLLPEAQRIAREKSAAEDFIDEARRQIADSDAALARGDVQVAQDGLEAAYRRVQQQVAALRAGDSFYLAVLPDVAPGARWQDGMRRIEERRFITQYLRVEASSTGLDVAALERGVEDAERTVADAQRMAAEQRWQPALQKLDLAYAQFEESWRTAGVDW